MTLFWIGAGLLVLGAVGFLAWFAAAYNTSRSPTWAKGVGRAGVVAMIAGTFSIIVSAYYAIAGWLT